jgi:AraC-like DNA-binding protein
MANLRCQTGLPHPALRSWVSHYWILEGELEGEARSQTLFPGGNVLLVLQLGSPVHLLDPAGAPLSRPSAFAEGHHRRPFRLRFSGRFRLAGAEFLPGRGHPLLGGTQRPLNDAFVDLREIGGRDGALLEEEAAEAPTMAGVTAAFDRFLRGRRPVTEPGPPGVRRALDLAAASGGRATVADLAEAGGLGPRQLERQFRRTIGLGPKYFCRVLRFRELLRQIAEPDARDLGWGAQDCGYYDQPHMIRDFRAFTGECPTGFLARRHELHRALTGLRRGVPGPRES